MKEPGLAALLLHVQVSGALHWHFALAATLPAHAGPPVHFVVPDTHWNDTSGKRIEAHAAGMLQSPDDQRWYWFGESKKLDESSDPHKYETQGVNCYSATTIAGPWKNEGQVLTQSDIKVPGAHGPWIVQRPKVIYNNVTGRFVMYFHLDQPKHKDAQTQSEGYQFRRVGTATAANAAGPYTFVRGFQPDGIPSLDMNLFKDPLDGNAYLIRDCEHQYVGISRLSSDYLNTTGIINRIPDCEGMAMLRLSNGTYYMITSHETGWNPNPLIAWRSTTTNLATTNWTNLGNPTSSPTSFNSQPTYIVSYTPASGKPYFVYMGDDWMHCPNSDGTTGPLVNACYIWLPIRIYAQGASPQGLPIQIDDRSQWSLDDPFNPSSLRLPPPPSPPTPSPAPQGPPQPTPIGYTKHQHAYCSDHGGARTFHLHMPILAECAARCTAAHCKCFDYQASSGSCRGTTDATIKDSSHGDNAYTPVSGSQELEWI